MPHPTKEFTNRAADYQQVRVETITLVNVMSQNMVSSAAMEAGIGLQFTPSGENGAVKNFRVALLSPTEIARGNWSEEGLHAKIAEILTSTQIGENKKRGTVLFLDPESPYFEPAVERLTMMGAVAAANFAKEMEQLVALYDRFTNAQGAKLPQVSAFYAQAAFANGELLMSYRQSHHLPEVVHPMLTHDARAMLKRFNIPTEHIPDYDPAKVALNGKAKSSLHSLERDAHAVEVQVMLGALQNSAKIGDIKPVFVSPMLREALAAAIAQARAAHHPATDAEPRLHS